MFLIKDFPNFIWNDVNAVVDMGLIIESELPEVSPAKRVNPVTVLGYSGELHETFNDYDAYDLTVENITIPYEKLEEVKRWLTGAGKLITHNDPDKYRTCYCSMGKAIEYQNEWGYFYTFNVTFRCQPFKRKIREQPILFDRHYLTFMNHGSEISKPVIELDSQGGSISLELESQSLTILNSMRGTIRIDNEYGKVVQNGQLLFTKGEWLTSKQGMNRLKVAGDFSNGKIYVREVYL